MSDSQNDIMWEKYLYPGTNVLKNKLNIADKEKLKQVEATITFEKLLELHDKPIDLDLKANHLKAIHKYLFDEIYPFAGEYRNVNLKKGLGGFLWINDEQDIEQFLTELFNEIDYLLEICRDEFQFCELLSKMYTQLIYCHPFREGNGRSIREFTREFSIQKSRELGLGEMELDWSLIDKEALDSNITVAHLFPGETALFFKEALVKKDKSVLK